jgi:nucleoside-diphosphate-sugar epimerase
MTSARDAERETARFTARGGQGIVLRFGAFYAPYAPSTVDTVRLARRRLFPVTGKGDAYISSIHVDDAATAVVAALEVPAGVYNVVDDEPLRMREYVEALTQAFGFGRARHIPMWLARIALGAGAPALLRSQRVANTMFKAVTKWSPRHPSPREGWRAVAAELGRGST